MLENRSQSFLLLVGWAVGRKPESISSVSSFFTLLSTKNWRQSDFTKDGSQSLDAFLSFLSPKNLRDFPLPRGGVTVSSEMDAE